MGKQYDLHVYSLLVQFCSTSSPLLDALFCLSVAVGEL